MNPTTQKIFTMSAFTFTVAI